MVDHLNVSYLFKNQGINPFGEVEFIQSFVFEVDDLSTSRTITIADYDNDGDQDIYVIRKFSINWLLENQTLTGEPGNVVYNSNPNPLFLEVSQSLSLDDQNVSTSGSMGYGAAWGDYDNDEDYDLYLANWGVNRLYKNDSGNFENVIEETSTNADTLNNGLAWPDLDNDGVPNKIDKCPNEAGSKELSGCPIIPQSLSSYLNNYGEIFFGFDSSKLSSEQKINLLNLSDLLKKYQHINLNIDGHASNEGESDYNMLLSEKRSNSVKETLTSDGIQDERLNKRSFGEDDPIYPNIPLSERKKNRRVRISVNKNL